jgi:hypothetical protein
MNSKYLIRSWRQFVQCLIAFQTSSISLRKPTSSKLREKFWKRNRWDHLTECLHWYLRIGISDTQNECSTSRRVGLVAYVITGVENARKEKKVQIWRQYCKILGRCWVIVLQKITKVDFEMGLQKTQIWPKQHFSHSFPIPILLRTLMIFGRSRELMNATLSFEMPCVSLLRHRFLFVHDYTPSELLMDPLEKGFRPNQSFQFEICWMSWNSDTTVR